MSNATTDVMRAVRAVRRFREGSVPEEDLNEILEVARWTGTASNRQSWDVVVVRDRDLLEQLSACGVTHLATAAVGLVLVSQGQVNELQAFDEGRIAERVMVAAQALGLRSAPGWFKDGGRERARQLIGAPGEATVRTAVSLGHPAEGAEIGGRRRQLASLVHEGRW